VFLMFFILTSMFDNYDLANVRKHHCADVPFTWRRPADAAAFSQQLVVYVVREGRSRVGHPSGPY